MDSFKHLARGFFAPFFHWYKTEQKINATDSIFYIGFKLISKDYEYYHK